VNVRSGHFWPSPTIWAGLGPALKRWENLLGRDWPHPTFLGSAQSARPTQAMYIYICVCIYIYIYLKKTKKNPKNFKNHFKKIVIFSNNFLPILHNIGLYIYTVKYKSGIKIPRFLQNISKQIQKKISKTFKLIFPFKNKKKIVFMHTAKS
jgi:hypothetical protein